MSLAELSLRARAEPEPGLADQNSGSSLAICIYHYQYRCTQPKQMRANLAPDDLLISARCHMSESMLIYDDLNFAY